MACGRFAVGCVAALLSAAPTWAAEGDRPPSSITVQGHATREVQPDLAVITIGVSTERASAREAATANGAAAQAVLSELRASGVAPADTATTEATLAPLYDEPADNKPRRIRTYRATNTVSIRIRKLDSVGDLAGRLIDKGANTLEGVDYTVDEPDPVLDQLRAEATRDAKRRATIYAEAAGVRLGRVLSILPETTAPFEARSFKIASADAAAAPTVPVQPGMRLLEDRVSITWALDEP